MNENPTTDANHDAQHWLDRFLPNWVDFERIIPVIGGTMLREAGRLHGVAPGVAETEDQFRQRLLALVKAGRRRVGDQGT